MILKTKRLTLRPITMEDSKAMYEYSKEPNVGPNAGWKPHESEEETKALLPIIFLEKEDVWGIVETKSNILIGSIGLIDDPKRENEKARMLGYAIGEAYWGKGYMSEAVQALVTYGFKELSLDLISAYCYPFNTRSQHVVEKAGLQYEGTLALAEKIYTGEVFDLKCYAIKKTDFIK